MNPSSGPEPRDNAARGVLQATILASMVLVPAQVARVMFVMGLKGEPLLAAGIIVGIGLAMHLVLKARHQHKRIAFWIASWSTGGLCFLAGLLALFSLDAGNVPTVVVLTTMLLAAYFTAQLLVNVAPRDGIAVPGTGGRWLLAGTGGLLLAIFVVQWIVPAAIQLPLHLDTATSTVADATWFLYCGPLFLVAPLVHASATSPATAPGTGEATSDQPAPVAPPRERLPVRTGVILAGTTALFTMLFTLFVYATLVAASRKAAVAHLGIAAGATGGLAVARATRRAAPLAWIAAGILAISFAAFATSGYPENLAGYDFTAVKGEVERHPEFFDLELGQALGPMTRVAGRGGHAWQREFEHGIVLVNPYHAQAPGFQDNDPVFAPSN